MSIVTPSLRPSAASAIKKLILGGRALLLTAVSVGLLGCATTQQITDGPPPRPETIEALIYQWDAIERRQKPAPDAYRDQYVAALKALSASLAETEKWRHRAESQ
ncbi:MAG: hypothetical protein EBT75_10320 [Proteobacteria bacterium]|nr:hypothetical protein [Pseudomonadota bacterium]NBS49868.1 hypothetical protein [Verrucomicrobiota bacterium]